MLTGPSTKWQKIGTLLPILGNVRSNSKVLLSTTNTPNNTEIWINRLWVNLDNIEINEPQNEFWIFSTELRKWKKISNIIQGTNEIVGNVFKTKNGDIWGQNYNKKPELPILSKFNRSENRFEFVEKSQEIPGFSQKKESVFHEYPQIIIDDNDTFWIFVNYDGIYIFNTKTQEVKKQTTIPDLQAIYPIISMDGSLYYIQIENSLDNIGSFNKKVFHFIPNESRIEEITPEFENQPIFRNVLSDKSGRLIFGNSGWKEPDDKWFQLLQSPIFLNNEFNEEKPADYFQFDDPEVIFQSSNGWIWYRFNRGLTYLDIEKKEWCWVTTESSNIIEDDQENLWFSSNEGILFKMNISQ